MITIAICTFNNAGRLPVLITELRKQTCDELFEILVVDNNSKDETQAVVERLKVERGPALRSIVEFQQGIPFARNRAIEESLNSRFLFFIDDDELPEPGWLSSAFELFENKAVQCVGGRIRCVFEPVGRPSWLGDELLGFLGEVNHGPDAFCIKDRKTPIWSGNIAYRVSLFQQHKQYRFDHRYNRKGKGIGGGSNGIMFQTFLLDSVQMMYCPDMIINHYIEPWRLKRGYFLRLHFKSGTRHGQFQSEHYSKTVFGVPFFMISQTLRQSVKSLRYMVTKEKRMMRQAMNAAHAFGMIYGRFLFWINKIPLSKHK